MKEFLLAFIPIFVAVDAIGVLPIYLSLTQGISKQDRARVIMQSLVTALCLAIGFIYLGRAVFKFLNITMGDFMIAGGFILFCIAIRDILVYQKRARLPINELGAVPIGTPLIVGPAVLTTSLIMVSEYGTFITLLSVLVNVFLAGVIFWFSEHLLRLLGEAGTKALSKIMSLFLGAIAVMMVRKGLILIMAAVGDIKT